jgi:hypothetical protein
MQIRRYSKRTIDSYRVWIKTFILFPEKQMGTCDQIRHSG